MDLITTNDIVKFEAKCLDIKDIIDFSDWIKIGDYLKNVEGAVQFWIGDWLNYGEKVYGETYTQALEATDYTYKALSVMKWVCGKVLPESRSEGLSFKHHEVIAKLEKPEQKKYLDMADAQKMTVSQLRQAVNDSDEKVCEHSETKKIGYIVCSKCGENFGRCEDETA